MLSATDTLPVGGANRREGGEGEEEGVEGTGLLADTMKKVDRSFRARLVAGSSEDLGYQYFVEKVSFAVSHDIACPLMSTSLSCMQLMSSIKTVLIEMLSQFEAKGKLGAKVIREQLHSAWPVPGSRTAQDQLRRELLGQLKQELEVVGWPDYIELCSVRHAVCVCR